LTDDESKPQPLDYEKPSPKRRTWRIVLVIVGTTIISLIAALVVASFLLPDAGGH
jgi:hypothetical protein